MEMPSRANYALRFDRANKATDVLFLKLAKLRRMENCRSGLLRALRARMAAAHAAQCLTDPIAEPAEVVGVAAPSVRQLS